MKKDRKQKRKKGKASSQPKYGRGLWKNIRKMRKSAPFKKQSGALKAIEEDKGD